MSKLTKSLATEMVNLNLPEEKNKNYWIIESFILFNNMLNVEYSVTPDGKIPFKMYPRERLHDICVLKQEGFACKRRRQNDPRSKGSTKTTKNAVFFMPGQ